MLRFAVVFALALIGSTAVLDRAGFAQEEGFRVPDLQHLGLEFLVSFRTIRPDFRTQHTPTSSAFRRQAHNTRTP
jgi:hypothetical protein